LLRKQLCCDRRGSVLDIIYVPVVRQMRPFSEALSHERPVFGFFDLQEWRWTHLEPRTQNFAAARSACWGHDRSGISAAGPARLRPGPYVHTPIFRPGVPLPGLFFAQNI